MKNWARESLTIAMKSLDIQIHREVLRLRASYQLSLDEFRGLYVSDKQVDTLIQSVGTENGKFTDIDELNRNIAKIKNVTQQKLQQDQLWHNLCLEYSLSLVEQDLIFWALAPELNSKYEVLYAYLNNDVGRKFPSVELAMRFAQDGESNSYRAALSSQGKLMQSGLLESCQTSSVYQLQSGFKLSGVVRDYLLGNQLSASELEGIVTFTAHKFLDWSELPFTSGQSQEMIEAVKCLLRDSGRLMLNIESGTYSAAELLLHNALQQQNSQSIHLHLKALSTDHELLYKQLRLLAQLLVLLDDVLVIDARDDQWFSKGSNKRLLEKTLAFFACSDCGLVMLHSTKADWRPAVPDRSRYELLLPPPDAAQRYKIWRHFVDGSNIQINASSLNQVADFFKLDYQQIHFAVDHLTVNQSVPETNAQGLTTSQLFKSAARQCFSEIGNLAEKINNQFNFEHLILPPEVNKRIREVVSAVRNRKLVYEDWGLGRRLGGNNGIMVMFSGSSGTGKTMAASAVANEIGLDLYRIDLSRVISKYIGETEKNLDRVFSAASQANCILFFDEADAIFGKRSEVKDAHDRYANVEVAYLLQKMEEHDGIALLTTNLAKNIDQAFTRRLQFIIEFPRPDAEHRELIWLSMLKDNIPLHESVDFKFLARQFSNTGGDIKNIVLDAALQAAESENKKIDMPMLLRASARQMVKQGKVPSASEFKHYFGLVSSANQG